MKSKSRGIASMFAMGLIPGMIENDLMVQQLKKKYEPEPCFNKECDNDRTPGKLYCSAECCKGRKFKGEKQ